MTWRLKNRDVLVSLMELSRELFFEKYGYRIYKDTSSFDQLIKQAEIDVVGLAFEEGLREIYAVDIAFHEGGLSYGSREDTVSKVIKKCLRSVMCIVGYYGFAKITIVFAAPKMNPAMARDVEVCRNDIQAVLKQAGIDCDIEIITNKAFSEKILEPVLNVIGDVADTSELFMRSLQLYRMFMSKKEPARIPNTTQSLLPVTPDKDLTGLKEMKVGALVRHVTASILQREGFISPEEIELLQTSAYSKQTFHIAYPLLQNADQVFDKSKYYAQPLSISGVNYYLFSQWYASHHPYVLAWIMAHQP